MTYPNARRISLFVEALKAKALYFEVGSGWVILDLDDPNIKTLEEEGWPDEHEQIAALWQLHPA